MGELIVCPFFIDLQDRTWDNYRVMWIFLSILGAFFQALEVATKKKTLQVKGMNNFIAFLGFMISGLLLGILLFIKTGELWLAVQNDFNFWNGIFWAVLLNSVAIYFLFKALSIADLSYLMPWFALSSIFVIVPPIFLFGEIPSIVSFFGILVIVVGALLMEKNNILDVTKEAIEKRKNNFRARLYLIIVLACYSVTPTVTKLAIIESSALYVSFLLSLLIGIFFILFIFLLREHKEIFSVLSDLSVGARRNFIIMIILSSVAGMISYTSVNIALGMADVAYVMAIKRIMPIFAFGIGYFYFKEKMDARRKITATILMVAGVILVVFFR